MSTEWGPRAHQEFWNLDRIKLQMQELEAIKEWAVVSGGLAWHLMSPPHEERKAVHDHKDIDIFVDPEYAGQMIATLKDRGFDRAWTKYDGKTPNFVRYTKYVEDPAPSKIMIDLFSVKVPSVKLPCGISIVDPKHLITLYSSVHSSTGCVAVVAAYKLIQAGIDPIGRHELVGAYGSSVASQE